MFPQQTVVPRHQSLCVLESLMFCFFFFGSDISSLLVVWSAGQFFALLVVGFQQLIVMPLHCDSAAPPHAPFPS
jgi:hypothetical protein